MTATKYFGEGNSKGFSMKKTLNLYFQRIRKIEE